MRSPTRLEFSSFDVTVGKQIIDIWNQSPSAAIASVNNVETRSLVYNLVQESQRKSAEKIRIRRRRRAGLVQASLPLLQPTPLCINEYTWVEKYDYWGLGWHQKAVIRRGFGVFTTKVIKGQTNTHIIMTLFGWYYRCTRVGPTYLFKTVWLSKSDIFRIGE